MNRNDCQKCGAPQAYSQRSGKWYCSAKCWLNQPQGNQSRPQYNPPPRKEPDWDSIRNDKAAEIRENVLIKEAGEFVRAIYEKGEIKADQIIPSFFKILKQLEIEVAYEPENTRDNPQQNISEENNGGEVGW